LEILSSFRNGFVCGKDNPIGLKLKIFKKKNTVNAEFIPEEKHQGYEGIVHGGIIFSIMDELMSRAVMTAKGIMALTVEINIKYRRKAKIGKKIVFIAGMIKDSGRMLEVEGKAFSEDGILLVEAKGKFYEISKKMKEKVADYFS